MQGTWATLYGVAVRRALERFAGVRLRATRSVLVVKAWGLSQSLSFAPAFFLFQDSVARGSGHRRGDSRTGPVEVRFDLTPQNYEGDSFVLVLTTLLATDHHDSGGMVAQAYGCASAIDVLAAGSSGAKDIDFALG